MGESRILTVLVLLDRIILCAVKRGCMSSGGGNAFDALAYDSADWLFAFADEEYQGSVCPSRSPVQRGDQTIRLCVNYINNFILVAMHARRSACHTRNVY